MILTIKSEHFPPRILNVRWPEVISNIMLWETTGETPVEPQIKKTKMEVDREYY
jgi:hypothetical protein